MHIDFNGPAVQVVQSSDQRISVMIKSAWEEYNRNTVLMLQEEHSHLRKRIPFKCKHDVSRNSLVARCSKAFKFIAVPGPRIVYLNVAKRIGINHLQNEDIQGFTREKLQASAFKTAENINSNTKDQDY